MEGGRRRGMMEGSRMDGRGWRRVELQEARKRSKNRRDLRRKREESWGKGQREGGQRGQEREGVINEDIAKRWRDKEGKKERVKG